MERMWMWYKKNNIKLWKSIWIVYVVLFFLKKFAQKKKSQRNTFKIVCKGSVDLDAESTTI